MMYNDKQLIPGMRGSFRLWWDWAIRSVLYYAVFRTLIALTVLFPYYLLLSDEVKANISVNLLSFYFFNRDLAAVSHVGTAVSIVAELATVVVMIVCSTIAMKSVLKKYSTLASVSTPEAFEVLFHVAWRWWVFNAPLYIIVDIAAHFSGDFWTWFVGDQGLVRTLLFSLYVLVATIFATRNGLRVMSVPMAPFTMTVVRDLNQDQQLDTDNS